MCKDFGERVGQKVSAMSIPAKVIMVQPVITVLPDSKFRHAEAQMHKFNISSLVIIDKGPVGVITKRDFLELLAQMEKPVERLTVQFSIKDVEIDESQRGAGYGRLRIFPPQIRRNFRG
jgi:CBS domain-containing protein